MISKEIQELTDRVVKETVAKQVARHRVAKSIGEMPVAELLEANALIRSRPSANNWGRLLAADGVDAFKDAVVESLAAAGAEPVDVRLVHEMSGGELSAHVAAMINETRLPR